MKMQKCQLISAILDKIISNKRLRSIISTIADDELRKGIKGDFRQARLLLKQKPTKVVFRVWLEGSQTVIALFPDEDAGNGNCMSYEHIGQHGATKYKYVLFSTRPATSEEYKDLHVELKKIGYTLDVVEG
jgi:hypothetical protein